MAGTKSNKLEDQGKQMLSSPRQGQTGHGD